ncbi:MAG: hypothetical protein NTX01_07910 [Candidatus Omnitrophica bacterium]|nr:hypothetical protein [Candidatus Omnitrophota bacterium]
MTTGATIARVFPTKTSMSPIDKHAYFDTPDLFTPKYEEAHISCTFTWDIPKAKRLVQDWSRHAKVVRLGGVAIDGESDKPFQAGFYLREGVTITSRGCTNNCSFCLVRRGVIEFDNFPEGNIIQDNNILACSDKHWRLVLDMLKKEKAIEFKGGLEKYRITEKIAEDLRGLKIKTLWLACDQPSGIKALRKAVKILHKSGFTQNHIYCFVLIGDDLIENESRLREVYKIGAMPFAQLFRNKDNSISYSKEFKQFARKWSRPAIIKTVMEETKNEKSV